MEWTQFAVGGSGAVLLLTIAARFLMRQGAGYQQLLADQRAGYEARISGLEDELRWKDGLRKQDQTYYRGVVDRLAAENTELRRRLDARQP